MMKRTILYAMLFLALPARAGAEERSLTLQEAILLACKNSVDAAVALNELKTAYWQYRSYRADLLPEVNFNATLPNYTKAYSAYQQSDGSYTYLLGSYMNLSGEVSASQRIWPTGGTLSLTSSLDYFHQFGHTTSQAQPKNSFMSIPLALTLSQPIFGVNTTKWNRRIEPVRYREAKAAYVSATEQVTITAISHFFTLLLARENVGIARQNLENAEKLYEVAKGKRQMGQISQNDLLQMELNTLEARSALTEGESTMKSRMFQLKSFLVLEDSTEVVPQLPDMPESVALSYEDVLERAHQNNAFAQNIRRRQLEADYDVARAKGDLRKINLFAQIGYTGTDHGLTDAYSRLRNNQVVQMGMSIPLLDWGKRKGKVRVAESNREVTLGRLRKEAMEFDQDIFILVEQFLNQQQQLQIARRANEIAQCRYQTNVETFLIGKLSTLDLNDSQTSKDEARRKEINELFLYWYYYYQLRSLTLWDWHRGTSIDADFQELVGK